MGKIHYQRNELDDLMKAVILDAVSVAIGRRAVENSKKKNYREARKAYLWLETEGRDWMQTLGMSIDRPSLWLQLNHYQGLLALREALETLPQETASGFFCTND